MFLQRIPRSVLHRMTFKLGKSDETNVYVAGNSKTRGKAAVAPTGSPQPPLSPALEAESTSRPRCPQARAATSLPPASADSACAGAQGARRLCGWGELGERSCSRAGSAHTVCALAPRDSRPSPLRQAGRSRPQPCEGTTSFLRRA